MPAQHCASTSPPTNEPTFWHYEDLGIVFVVVTGLGSVLRLVMRLHAVRPLFVFHQGVWGQLLVAVIIGAAIFTVLRVRHRRPVWRPLGWIRPSGISLMMALAGGGVLAVAVYAFVQLRHIPVVSSSVPNLIVLGLLAGPLLEESLFRGFLLPLLAHSLGNTLAIVLAALVFALFHGPTDVVHWFWITFTGAAYGFARIRSGSTVSPAVMHGAYNLTLGLLFMWFPV